MKAVLAEATPGTTLAPARDAKGKSTRTRSRPRRGSTYTKTVEAIAKNRFQGFIVGFFLRGAVRRDVKRAAGLTKATRT